MGRESRAGSGLACGAEEVALVTGDERGAERSEPGQVATDSVGVSPSRC